MSPENGTLKSIQELNEMIRKTAAKTSRRLENLAALTAYLEGSNNNEMSIDACMLGVITEYLKNTIAMENAITDSARTIKNDIKELMEAEK